MVELQVKKDLKKLFQLKLSSSELVGDCLVLICQLWTRWNHLQGLVSGLKQEQEQQQQELETFKDKVSLLQSVLEMIDSGKCIKESMESIDGLTWRQLESLDKSEIEKVDASEYELWWANKKLLGDKKLFEYTGINEKTKIIVKIQKKGNGVPIKENPLDEEGQKHLLAYYYRKQEEEKKLALAAASCGEDLRSDWANPSALKNQFNGISGTIKWNPR